MHGSTHLWMSRCVISSATAAAAAAAVTVAGLAWLHIQRMYKYNAKAITLNELPTHVASPRISAIKGAKGQSVRP